MRPPTGTRMKQRKDQEKPGPATPTREFCSRGCSAWPGRAKSPPGGQRGLSAGKIQPLLGKCRGAPATGQRSPQGWSLAASPPDGGGGRGPACAGDGQPPPCTAVPFSPGSGTWLAGRGGLPLPAAREAPRGPCSTPGTPPPRYVLRVLTYHLKSTTQISSCVDEFGAHAYWRPPFLPVPLLKKKMFFFSSSGGVPP